MNLKFKTFKIRKLKKLKKAPKLKIDGKFKHKTRCYKTPKRKHNRNTL